MVDIVLVFAAVIVDSDDVKLTLNYPVARDSGWSQLHTSHSWTRAAGEPKTKMKNTSWKLTETFEMKGGGKAASFKSADGRTMRVDFFDKERLEEYGLDSNIEVFGEGPGWEKSTGELIQPKLHKYMIDQILNS